ncbi:MAG: type II secretion system protein [Desulfuromonadaceae bacterium]|nr:type II secretion system protein [Desulfuromonadaceae bacterium]MDD5106162.1 type II secretion system protein [Desulfuromonadaceae bacterium]
MKTNIMNQSGFTFLMVVFMVVIVGILSAFTGKSWTTIVKREREKELIFRGSQIKEAIENWNNPKYTVPGVPPRSAIPPLNDLADLLKDPKVRYLPQHYSVLVENRDPKCAPDCGKILKVYQDPMTGGPWTVLRGTVTNGAVTINAGIQSGNIIGVASKSDESPFRSDFKDTALENITNDGLTTTIGNAGAIPAVSPGGTEAGSGDKYSDWKFIADPKNDHTKIYRAYHEGW